MYDLLTYAMIIKLLITRLSHLFNRHDNMTHSKILFCEISSWEWYFFVLYVKRSVFIVFFIIQYNTLFWIA